MTNRREAIDMSVELSGTQFSRCQNLIATLTGIQMSDAKRGMVTRRVSNRMQDLGLSDVDAYLGLLDSGDSAEVENFRNAVTTNLTSFFRENHHFDFLRSSLLRAAAEGDSAPIRIWSAACSTGEEPYSIVMTLAETLPLERHDRFQVVATDIDTDVLAKARSGVYSNDRIEGISPERLKRWFLRGKGARAGMVRVKPMLQEKIDFRQVNLLGEWPDLGQFDVVFCRNVVIYFDKPTQVELVRRFHQVIKPEGLLVMGHSESLHSASNLFRLLGRTIYQKVA